MGGSVGAKVGDGGGSTSPAGSGERSATAAALSKRGYSLIAHIGDGYFGKVKLVRSAIPYQQHLATTSTDDSSQLAAVKIVDMNTVTEAYREKFLQREVYVWRQLRHRHLIQLIDWFQDGSRLFMIMEYAENKDLLDYVQKYGAIDELHAKRWITQLVSAICYLHNNQIAHRDLKLENVLIDRSGELKIADFGFSRYLSVDEMSSTYCGSPSYSAPEILLGHKYDPFAADIWALGVIAFVMVTNRMPFDEKQPNLTMVECQRKHKYHYPGKLVESGCAQFIYSMLTFDYRLRPTIFTIANCDYLTPNRLRCGDEGDNVGNCINLVSSTSSDYLFTIHF